MDLCFLRRSFPTIQSVEPGKPAPDPRAAICSTVTRSGAVLSGALRYRHGGTGSHYAILPNTLMGRVSELDRWGIQPIWYEVVDGRHDQVLDVFRHILEMAHPELKAFRLRRERGGVAMWLDWKNERAAVVDRFGNIGVANFADTQVDLSMPVEAMAGVTALFLSHGAEDGWVYRERGRWKVGILWKGHEIQIADHETRKGAVEGAILSHPALFHNEKVGKVTTRRMTEIDGSYHFVRASGFEREYLYFTPHGCPDAVLPLGPRTIREGRRLLSQLQG